MSLDLNSLKPSVLHVNGENKAPVTFIDLVFGRDGTSLKDKLDGYVESTYGTWSNSTPMLTARYALAGSGTQTAALCFGGINDADIYATTEKFNGDTWSSAADMLTARHTLAGSGTQTAALCFSGIDITDIYATTEKFNGDTWSSAADMLTARYALAGSGTQTAALCFGGINDADTYATTEKFNGDTWSSAADMLTARYALAGCGAQDAALSFGGINDADVYATTEKFNGDTWSSAADMLTARYGLAGCGVQNAALSFGGINNADVYATTEKFNGDTWSSAADMLTARYALAGCGAQDAALSFGGIINPKQPSLSNTEKYNTRPLEEIIYDMLGDISSSINEEDVIQIIENNKSASYTMVENVTISKDSWVDDTEDSGYWTYDITNESIAANNIVNVNFSKDTIKMAEFFRVQSFTTTSDGKVTIYAEEQPIADMSVDIIIF